ncbi:MAG: DUF4136 domain-containing protein [Rhodospirillales bacterium]|nr:DUF4136 domain-containing protein [Rhodospirillales bacterium]
MRASANVMVGLLLLGVLAGCQKTPKVSPQEQAIAAQTAQQMNIEPAAVAQSRYRKYRWMTDEEMVQRRLGYDPTMSGGTRFEVEQAIDDDLADKGFQKAEPADFIVAFNDVYIDRSRSAPGGAFMGTEVEATGGVGGSQMEAYDDMEVYRTPEEGFTIMFFDASTRRLLWRGTGREHFASMSGTQSDDAIETAIYHALDDMPVPLAP